MHAWSHTASCKFKEIWVNSKRNLRLDTDLIVRASNNFIIFFFSPKPFKTIYVFIDKNTS